MQRHIAGRALSDYANADETVHEPMVATYRTGDYTLKQFIDYFSVSYSMVGRQ